MPLLLEDLAEETAGSLRRTVERFESAAKELSARRDGQSNEEHRDEIARFARHLTDFALAELPRAEAIWKWEGDQPLKGQSDAEVERRLVALQAVFALQAQLCVIARSVWKHAESLGCTPEQHVELDKAWRRFVQLAHRMKSDREYRAKGWQPRDPERFAEAMRRLEAGEMVFITAEEALARFRRS
ncbi:MAG: hypothetical protein L0241_04605 [Planctomycetia bacterium]|nr:hypothetical protein [Planctomycetia bacterium]